MHPAEELPSACQQVLGPRHADYLFGDDYVTRPVTGLMSLIEGRRVRCGGREAYL